MTGCGVAILMHGPDADCQLPVYVPPTLIVIGALHETLGRRGAVGRPPPGGGGVGVGVGVGYGGVTTPTSVVTAICSFPAATSALPYFVAIAGGVGCWPAMMASRNCTHSAASLEFARTHFWWYGAPSMLGTNSSGKVRRRSSTVCPSASASASGEARPTPRKVRNRLRVGDSCPHPYSSQTM